MRTTVVANPRAAGGALARRWGELERAAHEAFGPFELLWTRGPGDGEARTREALERDAERVVAVGGDGTASEVVAGFFDGGRPRRPEALFALLPFGTGGDLRRTLGLSRDPRAAARSLRRAEPRPIDVGLLRFRGRDGAEQARAFINIASFGISGLIDSLVEGSSKRLGGTASFLTATVRAQLRFRGQPVRLRLDDGAPDERTIHCVAVANGRFFGGGMEIAPGAELDDGAFDVVTLDRLTRLDLLRHGLKVYRGRHLGLPQVSVQRARRVVAEPIDRGDPVLLDVDGEPLGALPATFELLPGALRALIPPGSGPLPRA